MPELRVRLSDQSLDAAISRLQAYEDSIQDKAEAARKRIGERIRSLAETLFNGAVYDQVVSGGAIVPNVTVQRSEEGGTTVVFTQGEAAVFIEFGAGVYFNGPTGSYPHPDTPPGIAAIGTYGHGYGARRVWAFVDESGETVLTHGTPASMPMYYAVQDALPEIVSIFREEFRRGGTAL